MTQQEIGNAIMRQCKVYVHDMEAGILQETDAREYVLTYGKDYHGEPVCLAMPVRKEPYRSNHLFPYFYNMLYKYQRKKKATIVVDDCLYFIVHFSILTVYYLHLLIIVVSNSYIRHKFYLFDLLYHQLIEYYQAK